VQIPPWFTFFTHLWFNPGIWLWPGGAFACPSLHRNMPGDGWALEYPASIGFSSSYRKIFPCPRYFPRKINILPFIAGDMRKNYIRIASQYCRPSADISLNPLTKNACRVPNLSNLRHSLNMHQGTTLRFNKLNNFESYPFPFEIFLT